MTTNTKSVNELYRYKLLIKTIDRLEKSLWTELDVHWCCDTITWLWKWKKITEKEKNVLCERMVNIMRY